MGSSKRREGHTRDENIILSAELGVVREDVEDLRDLKS